mmetsp:Transcript_51331/g.160276  ORF Transcript_51331/g.160276 Transcript_51331/m.160276 type:complete len:205 (+) Transcript_51331:1933-2547(+)
MSLSIQEHMALEERMHALCLLSSPPLGPTCEIVFPSSPSHARPSSTCHFTCIITSCMYMNRTLPPSPSPSPSCVQLLFARSKLFSSVCLLSLALCASFSIRCTAITASAPTWNLLLITGLGGCRSFIVTRPSSAPPECVRPTGTETKEGHSRTPVASASSFSPSSLFPSSTSSDPRPTRQGTCLRFLLMPSRQQLSASSNCPAL